MKKMNKTVMEIIHDVLNDPIGFNGKKIAEMSNEEFLDRLKK